MRQRGTERIHRSLVFLLAAFDDHNNNQQQDDANKKQHKISFK